jgi:hypothetical protein
MNLHAIGLVQDGHLRQGLFRLFRAIGQLSCRIRSESWTAMFKILLTCLSSGISLQTIQTQVGCPYTFRSCLDKSRKCMKIGEDIWPTRNSGYFVAVKLVSIRLSLKSVLNQCQNHYSIPIPKSNISRRNPYAK